MNNNSMERLQFMNQQQNNNTLINNTNAESVHGSIDKEDFIALNERLN